ncbi:hypothetical protein OPV22_016649 [Ensete ventricosum]|uniref:PGG domain-containing protein n=1 Tax=Ensete ventricosum TaxID=4639 RepID=A0AAV8QLK4_ENSVE|nr:hypothetical protein OPV22_016649 [Ensete ventricosum]
MALLPAVAAFHVLAVLAVFYADRGGAPDEDIETVITRADNKAADSGGSELQVGGGDGKESGVETHGKTLPDKIVVAGNPEGREVHLRLPGAGAALVAQRQAQRRGRNGSRGSGDLEKFQITSAESDEARLGKRADSEARHIYAHAKPACGRDDESPRSPLQQKVHEEPSQKHDQVNSVSLDRMPEHLHTTLVASGVTQPANGETAIQVQILLNQPTEEGEVLRSSREEVIKSAMKFSYVSISISGAALVTIFFEYYVNLSGHSHSSHVKICTLIMLASFVSGVSILLLNFLQRHISVSLQLFRSLKCTTFALLVLALLDVSFIFMKIIALLAFVPTIAVVVIACVVAFGLHIFLVILLLLLASVHEEEDAV